MLKEGEMIQKIILVMKMKMKKNKKKNMKSLKKKTVEETEKMLIKEISDRMDCYFRVVVTQLADIVPRLIGFNLVENSLKNLQFAMYKTVTMSEEFNNLAEPPHIVARRDTLNKMWTILKDQRKILMRDPDLSAGLQGRRPDRELLELSAKERKKRLHSKDPEKTKMEEATRKLKKASKTAGESIKKGAIAAKKGIMKGATATGNFISQGVKKLKEKTKKEKKPEKSKNLSDGLTDEQKKALAKKSLKLAQDNPEVAMKVGKTVAKSAIKNKKRYQGLFGND